jgi:ABC-type multidrug transport system permease subunit
MNRRSETNERKLNEYFPFQHFSFDNILYIFFYILYIFFYIFLYFFIFYICYIFYIFYIARHIDERALEAQILSVLIVTPDRIVLGHCLWVAMVTWPGFHR